MEMKQCGTWLRLGMALGTACAAQFAGAAVFTAENAEIVLAKDAPKVVRFAAKEAKEMLSQTFAKEVPVVDAPTDGRTSLVLGFNSWAADAGLSTNELSRDSFTIAAKGNRVYVLGRDDAKTDPAHILTCGGWGSVLFERATMFGVYEFLEKFAGVRFYFPGELGTIAPWKEKVEVWEGQETVKPDFMSRFLQAWDGTYFEDDPKNAKKTLNYFRLRFETIRKPCCHGSIGFQYVRRFGKSHPEYFALLPGGGRSNNGRPDAGQLERGQLCWSSGIVDEIYEDAAAYLRGEPASTRGIPSRYGRGFSYNGNCSYGLYVDVMPDDGFGGCLCETCQAAYRKGDRNYASELVWGAVAKVARRLTENGIQGRICNMAYFPYRRVPEIDLPENVEVMVATRGPWSWSNPKQLARETQDMIDWSKKLGHKVWLWNYVCNFGVIGVKARDIPTPAPRAFVKYYRFVAPYTEGAFAESECDRWFFNALNYYALSRVYWRNSTDEEAMLAEHHALMFGAAKGEMAELYDRLEAYWMAMVGNVKETPMGPIVQPPPDGTIWNEIYSPAHLAELEALCDRALAKVAPGSLEARRIALVRGEFLSHMEKRAEVYHRNAAETAALRMSLAEGASQSVKLFPFWYGNRPAKTLVDTEVTVTRGRDAFVVKFDCEEPKMELAKARKMAPDAPDMYNDNCVEFFLWPADDGTYYQFMLNSEGSWCDFHSSAEGVKTEGAAWTCRGLKTRVEKGGRGWTAEFTVPFENFPGMKKSFKVNFARERNLRGCSDHEVLFQWAKHGTGFSDHENCGILDFK